MYGATGYSAEEGLKALAYLGFKALTKREEKIFRKEWDTYYHWNDRDFIKTVKKLYCEILPLQVTDQSSFVISTLRSNDFGKNLIGTKLDEKLKRGVPLERILSGSSEKYTRLN